MRVLTACVLTACVLTLARSLWHKTDAVVADTDVARGMARMLEPSAQNDC